MYNNITWHELLIRFALILFCLTVLLNKANMFTFPILILAWVVDGSYKNFAQIIKEPLIKGILVLCIVLLIGLLWSDFPQSGQMKWRKYFIFLIFIPFLSLLNKERLKWAIGALLTGYISVLVIGGYQRIILLEQGIPFLNISYLTFSAQLGIGVILATYFAGISSVRKISLLFWALALALLFLQFSQNGRGLLFATLITMLLMIPLLYRENIKKCMIILTSIMTIIFILAFSSPIFQERSKLVVRDIEQFQQGNYSTSVGYRLALWDIGLDGISKHPILGHGTGMPESYFKNAVKTYKGGVYKDLPNFLEATHYHNDWIEIGMHIGAIGILALGYLLWSWYITFRSNHTPILGIALVSYIFLSGLSDTFIIYSRISTLLLIITAIAICWQKQIAIENID